MNKKHAIIPIFITHEGCPNDCAFCNQKKITAYEKPMSLSEMKEQVKQYLSTLNPDSTYIELAFYGGSFTGIPDQHQEMYLKTAYDYLKGGHIHNIRLSTRPDYLGAEVLERLKRYKVGVVELGVQSLDDQVLLESKRGYKSECVYEGVNRLREAGIQVGIQLMLGLPGDTYDQLMETTEKVINLRPAAVRIYPTLVIQDTHLKALYDEGAYIPLDLETAVAWTAAMAKRLKADHIPIIRMGLQPTELISQGQSVVAGPFHPAFGQLVKSRLIRDEITTWLSEEQKISQFKEFKVISNPKTQSLLIGQRRCNLEYFRAQGYKVGVGVEIDLADGEILMVKVDIF